MHTIKQAVPYSWGPFAYYYRANALTLSRGSALVLPGTQQEFSPKREGEWCVTPFSFSFGLGDSPPQAHLCVNPS